MYPCYNDAGKWGFIDRSGRWVIAAQFEFATEFINGVAQVRDEGDALTFINTSGEVLLQCPFATYFSGNCSIARLETGDNVIVRSMPHRQLSVTPLDVRGFGAFDQKTDIRPTSTNMFTLRGDCTYIVRFDDVLTIKQIPPIIPFHSVNRRVIKFQESQAFKFLDIDSGKQVNPDWLDAQSETEGLTAVRLSDGWHYLDANSVDAFGSAFTYADDFGGGWAPVEIEDRRFMIDRRGSIIDRIDFAEVYCPNRFGFAVVVAGDEAHERYILAKSGKVVAGPYLSCDFHDDDYPHFTAPPGEFLVGRPIWAVIDGRLETIQPPR